MKIVDYDIRQKKNHYYMKRMREREGDGEDQHDTDCSWLERIWWGQPKKIVLIKQRGLLLALIKNPMRGTFSFIYTSIGVRIFFLMLGDILFLFF